MYAGSVVEYGDTDSLYEHRMHPYTEGLFNSIPDVDAPRSRLQVIQGLTPDPTDLPRGCRFHPRCPYALPSCSEARPEMVEWRPGHFVACPVRCGGLS
jgi:peptide/nickel transport system ATP-binding protein